MLTYPNIDPVIFHVYGPFALRWYGLMYLVPILVGWLFIKQQTKNLSSWSPEKVSDLIFYLTVGMIAGGRLGYMCFYDLGGWILEPLKIFRMWDGGMSFHGGIIGAFLGIYTFSKRTNLSLLSILDICAAITPVGLGTGRIANFINAELWGRVTDVPWGMVFPGAGDLPRHPSQLYECLLEGIILLIVVQIVFRRPHRVGTVTGVFLTGYGLARIFVEFFREPDSQYGYLAFDWLTMGQLLSLPMVILGLSILFIVTKKNFPYSKGMVPCVNTCN